MKVQFDDLTLVEANMLTKILMSFRAGQPFWWPPNLRSAPPAKESRAESTPADVKAREGVIDALAKSNGAEPNGDKL